MVTDAAKVLLFVHCEHSVRPPPEQADACLVCDKTPTIRGVFLLPEKVCFCTPNVDSLKPFVVRSCCCSTEVNVRLRDNQCGVTIPLQIKTANCRFSSHFPRLLICSGRLASFLTLTQSVFRLRQVELTI